MLDRLSNETFNNKGHAATDDGETTKLYYLLVKQTKFVKAVHVMARNDNEAAEMNRFRYVLKRHHKRIFGSFIYEIHTN